MKKKSSVNKWVLIVSISIVLVIFGLAYWLFTNYVGDEEYEEVRLDGYNFLVNRQYGYRYDNSQQYGYFDSDLFADSYVYVSDLDYKTLINHLKDYTNMGSIEKDSTVEETSFGGYNAFINSKIVHYDDVDLDYFLNVILIELEQNRTLILQYEQLKSDANEKIFNDIKDGLLNFSKQ